MNLRVEISIAPEREREREKAPGPIQYKNTLEIKTELEYKRYPSANAQRKIDKISYPIAPVSK